MVVAHKPLRGQQRRVLREILPVHDQVLPVHVDLDVVDALAAQLVDDVQGHADVPHQDLHRRLGVLVLQEERHAPLAASRRDLADTVDEARPRVCVRRLEGIVVALDPGPEDHLRADVAGEVGGLERLPQRISPHGVVRRRESALAEARIQVRAGGDRIDPVAGQRRPDVVEVVPRQLLRVVELVVVDVALEPRDGARHPLGSGLPGVLRLVAARHEARDHRAQRPDTEARLHALLPR